VSASGLRWGRIALGGVLIEVVMFAIFIPLVTISETAAYYVVPIAGVLTACGFGRWVASKAADRLVIHGMLTAAAASILWLSLVLASGGTDDTPILYHVTNVVRVAAGAAGGAWAGRARSRHRGAALV
jgi:hypothetical protein